MTNLVLILGMLVGVPALSFGGAVVVFRHLNGEWPWK